MVLIGCSPAGAMNGGGGSGMAKAKRKISIEHEPIVGVFAALALGAINLGTALGVGQITFGVGLVFVLLSSPSDRV